MATASTARNQGLGTAPTAAHQVKNRASLLKRRRASLVTAGHDSAQCAWS